MLTERQRQILDFLTKYTDAHGYPPTVREIGEAVGLASPSTVHAHLANLERAGLLKRDPTKPRALELVGRERSEAPAATVGRLPLVGQIAAGGPLLADQNVEDHIAVPETLHGDFLLRVKGDSMINAGILEGVTRNTVIELAEAAGVVVEEIALTRHDVYAADEVFLTGTGAEIIPVVKVDGRVIGTGKPGPITRQLRERYQVLVRS